MKKTRVLFLVVCLMFSLIGCSNTTTLKAPCPNYGASCAKKPINSWDFQTVS